MPGILDSESQGDPAAFLPLDYLERALALLPPSPTDAGRVAFLVSRGEHGRRTTPARVSMTPASGMPGDSWGRQSRPSPNGQLTVMEAGVATLVANGQPLELFGDQMILDLDLSAANLPPGSRLRAGTVTFEVTPMPHNGCGKYRSRFGDAALKFVSKPDLRHRNLRGIYMRVVEAGEVAVGDPVQVISRPSVSPAEPRSPHSSARV